MKNKFIYLGIITVILISLKILNPTFIKKLSLINYDFYQKNFINGEVNSVTIIDIDEKSLAKIGQFPWRRDIYYQILDNLNKFNPSAIAFDIVFSEEDKQNPKHLLNRLKKEYEGLHYIEVDDSQKIFIEGLKNSKSILPVIGEPKDNLVINNSKPKIRIIKKGNDPKNFLYSFKNKIISLEKLNNAAAGIGSISLIPSIDGIIRYAPVIINIDNSIWPSLSLEAVRISNNQKNLLVKTDANGISEIKTRTNQIKTDRNALINIKFKQFDKSNYISVLDILDNKFDKKRIENKIILIGSSAQALFDIVKIANGNVVPGVEVHAHLIDNIIKSESIVIDQTTVLLGYAILIISTIIIVISTIKIKPRFSIFIFVTIILIINLTSLVFFKFDYYVDPLFNTFAGAVIFLTSLYFKYLDENLLAIENDKKQMILKKEREIAGEVQKKLFPTDKNLEKFVYGKNTPAKDVSGDYYDFYKINENEFYFILGDVTGKGIKAGILMANAAAVFKSLAKMGSSVSKTALYINNQVKDSSYQAMFITAVLGKVNLDIGEMEYVNMGHEPMMVINNNFEFDYIKSTLPPMGLTKVNDESFFKTHFMNIKDKTILIYTDGVTEGYIDNNKELTVTGIENEIKVIKSRDPNKIIDHLTSILIKNNIVLRDDITCLGISI